MVYVKFVDPFIRNEEDGAVFVGALLFTMIINMFNGFAELSMTIMRLPVFYKHRDLLFHPPWTFTLPNFLLGIPMSVIESTVWIVMTYYSIGFAPEPSRYVIYYHNTTFIIMMTPSYPLSISLNFTAIFRFFKQLLLVFLIQQMAAGIFRLIAGVCRTMIIANTGGALMLLLVFMLGGFILPRGLNLLYN